MASTILTGQDTWCLDALAPGRTARGRILVAQRLYRRLITPERTLLGGEEEADFGLDLAAYVGSNPGRELSSILPVKVRNELLKDPAVDAVTVTATNTSSGGAVSWSLVVVAELNTDEELELLVVVSDVSVELLGVR